MIEEETMKPQIKKKIHGEQSFNVELPAMCTGIFFSYLAISN